MRILLVENDKRNYLPLGDVLRQAGHSVDIAEDVHKADKLLNDTKYGAAIVHIDGPGMASLDLLKLVKDNIPDPWGIVITEYSPAKMEEESLRLGALACLSKPIQNEQIIQLMQKIAVKRQAQEAGLNLTSGGIKSERSFEPQNGCQRTVEGNDSPTIPSNPRSKKKETIVCVSNNGFEGIIVESPVMRRVSKRILKVANKEFTVLITGETGSGKEWVSHAIHSNSPRKKGPFQKINCGALTETILESELFGHIKGAFSGAFCDKIGIFEAADLGTLLLDEVGEMPPSLQVKLLRILQDGTFQPVGSTKTRKVTVRIIAATNKNLKDLVKRKKFREDLYYRLNVLTIHLPPLRERLDDIPLLANHFIEKYSLGRKYDIAPTIMKEMRDYSWPGNIRELENAITRAIALADDHSELNPEYLLPKTNEKNSIVNNGGYHLAGKTRNEIMHDAIVENLKECNGNKCEVARILEIPRSTLYRMMPELGIDFEPTQCANSAASNEWKTTAGMNPDPSSNQQIRQARFLAMRSDDFGFHKNFRKRDYLPITDMKRATAGRDLRNLVEMNFLRLMKIGRRNEWYYEFITENDLAIRGFIQKHKK